MTAPAPARVPPRRVAAAWFLGFAGVVFAVALWLRGAGRVLLPLAALALLAVVVARIVKAIRAPVD